MLDRLISGAGALTDRADRLVRMLTSGRGPDIMANRPGSIVVIVLLLAVAVVFGLLAVEATDNPTPRTLAPGDIAAADDLGSRTYVTVGGVLATPYIEVYEDSDEDDLRDADEPTTGWYYFLIDDTGRGVTVRSPLTPDDLLPYTATGVLVRDPAYLSIDVREFAGREGPTRVELEDAFYIDAVHGPTGSPQPLHLDGAMPATGSTVQMDGTYMGYMDVCSADIDSDGVCEDSEVDLSDVFLIDPGTGRAITVVQADPPAPVTTEFTGMLRSDADSILAAKDTPGFDFEALGIDVSDRYLLVDEASPANGALSMAVAILAGLLAAILAVGLAGGYLVFRRSKRPLPSGGRTMEPGETIPIHVTGSLRTESGLLHVREALAVLVRYPLVVPAPAETASETDPEPVPEQTAPVAAAPPVLPPDAPTTVIVERENRPEGVALGKGELTHVMSGRVMPFRGARPALRVVAGTGTLLLSFDSTEARDRAAGELIGEAGLLIRGSIAGGAG